MRPPLLDLFSSTNRTRLIIDRKGVYMVLPKGKKKKLQLSDTYPKDICNYYIQKKRSIYYINVLMYREIYCTVVNNFTVTWTYFGARV